MDADPCHVPQGILEEAVHNAFPLRHSDEINVVKIREDELTIGQMALHCLQCWMLPEREQERHHGVSLFAALTLHDRVRGARIILPQVPCEDPASWHDVRAGRIH